MLTECHLSILSPVNHSGSDNASQNQEFRSRIQTWYSYAKYNQPNQNGEIDPMGAEAASQSW
jgi:hypothetical protein